VPWFPSIDPHCPGIHWLYPQDYRQDLSSIVNPQLNKFSHIMA
jgi:hypothetical protein